MTNYEIRITKYELRKKQLDTYFIQLLFSY